MRFRPNPTPGSLVPALNETNVSQSLGKCRNFFFSFLLFVQKRIKKRKYTWKIKEKDKVAMSTSAGGGDGGRGGGWRGGWGMGKSVEIFENENEKQQEKGKKKKKEKRLRIPVHPADWMEFRQPRFIRRRWQTSIRSLIRWYLYWRLRSLVFIQWVSLGKNRKESWKEPINESR